MTAHLSKEVWQWGDEVSEFVIKEIGEALKENKEFNTQERPDDPPTYTPGTYMIMSDADAIVYNIGWFLDEKLEDGRIPLVAINEFIKAAPNKKIAKQIVHGVIEYLGYNFVP